jgi:hypothetical protein
MSNDDPPKDATSKSQAEAPHKWWDSPLVVMAAKAITGVSVISGVVFATLQYVESKQEKRIEQSLALFRQFNTTPYTDYRKKINVVIIDHTQDIFEAASDEAKLAATMQMVVRNNKIETDIGLVMDFFDGVVYCAAKNICDPQISYDLFYARGHELYVTFYQYIKAQRGSFAGNDFGAGLETLVKLKKPANSK